MNLAMQVKNHALYHPICSDFQYGSSVMPYFMKIRLVDCVWNVFLWTKTIHLHYLTKYVLCHGRIVTESFVKYILC